MTTEHVGRAAVPRSRHRSEVATRTATGLPALAAEALQLAHGVETVIEVAVQRSRVSMLIMEARGEAEVEQFLRDSGRRG